MNKKSGLKRNSIILFILLLCLFLFWPYQARMRSQRPENEGALADVLQEKAHSKTDSAISQLLRVYSIQGLEPAKVFARDNSIEMDEDCARVVVEALSFGKSANSSTNNYTVQQLNNVLSDWGADIESTYNHLIQARIPLEALMVLKDYPTIKRIRLPLFPRTCVVSEGVSLVGAPEWQNVEPYKNDEEVKVCVLDLGFTGYQGLLGTELPPDVEARSFRADGNLFTNVHGTACAEIIHDMAPNAKLYLVNYGSDVEFYQAVAWLISQEVDVISSSVGWVNAGAGDGTGPINYFVEWAHVNGITWVNSSGNDADIHWMGTFNDTDSNGLHNFPDGDEIFQFYLKAGEWFGIFLNWDDWGTWSDYDYSGSGQDYDLNFYHWNGSSWDFLASSSNVQNGTQWPVEQIAGYVSPSGWYGIAIKKWSATRNVEFDMRIWGWVTNLEYNVPEESLGIPADSQYALSVGATDWQNDSYHFYSSRGPTKDGRIKPDLSAPSGISTFTYGYYQFYGTSASAPHVAGACALLKEKTPLLPEQIVDILENRALDLGDMGKDNLFGKGRLRLNK